MNKYKIDNIIRWFSYYAWIQTVDPLQLRFVDEVHFEPKSLKRRRGYAPRGSRIIGVCDEFIRERYSMALMTVPGATPRPFARLYADTLMPPNSFCLFSAAFCQAT
jgi:hypothetical protein